MKSLYLTLLLLIFLFSCELLLSQSFQYISPKDGSTHVSLNSNIILKANDRIDPASLAQKQITVLGNKSGVHSGAIKLSDDGKTILFIPAVQFTSNEDVVVNISAGIKTTGGAEVPQVSFHFRTSPLQQRININPLTFLGDGSLKDKIVQRQFYKTAVSNLSSDSLPSDLPKITIGASNNPVNGKIFLTNFNAAGGDSLGNYLMILNNDGSVVKYKKLDRPAFDFKVQPNGQLSYADVINMEGGYADVRWIVMDTTLTPVDTFQCGNGYTADLHDFLLLPNGHALVEAYDPEPVDMSTIVNGGNSNATVVGDVVQELDASKNVIFQWRSWDYLPITDSYIDLTTQLVDYIHVNALDLDSDGNILVSSRHFSTVIKIDRLSGNIDWFLGGKENNFTFINENEANSPNYFSFQHDVRLQPDGDFTLFDNGNQHSPAYSRAVEYKLDEQNKTATMMWEYRHTPDIYALAMGTVQKFSNGDALIGWGIAGSSTTAPAVTEIHQDKSTALELFLPPGEVSYRSYSFPWASGIPGAAVTIYEVLQGNTYKFNSANDTTGITIKFNQISSRLYANAIVTKYDYAPLDPKFPFPAPILDASYFNITGQGITTFNAEVHVALNNFPGITQPANTIVYAKPDTGAVFSPLPTSYDPAKNELVFTTTYSGNFTFGIPRNIDTVYAPVLLTPKDGEVVNERIPVNLVWGTRGVAKSYHVQVAADSLFGKLVVDDSNYVSNAYTIPSVGNDQKYYWRVNGKNVAGTSNWSNAELFYTAPPFIKVTSPNGGETVFTDSTYIVRWQDNFNDTVKIELIKNNNVVSVIKDSLNSLTNAFNWKVPQSVQSDSSYKIRVSSVSSQSLFAESVNTFKIEQGITSVATPKNIIKDYKLFQNYPNPFNPSTVIEYTLPAESNVRIDIFNAIGQRVATLVNAEQKSGDYNVTWNARNVSSGIYFYTLKTMNAEGKNFFMVKKMVLLK